MTTTFREVKDALEAVYEAIPSHITHEKTFLAQHGAGPHPALTRGDLQSKVRAIITLIEEGPLDLDEEGPDELSAILRRLDSILKSMVPHIPQQPHSAVTAFLVSIEQIHQHINALIPQPNPNETTTLLRRLRKRAQTIESHLSDLEPRTTTLDEMLSRIEAAHDTADQLPADLQYLAEKRDTIKKMASDAEADRIKTAALLELLDQHKEQIEHLSHQAEKTLERCEHAYSASTSVGLAAAFSERAAKLNTSVWIWTACLTVSLGAAVLLGLFQLGRLATLIQSPAIPTSIIILNFLTSALTVGAPIWFAWLATKQVGQRFRLAEDYAFKASISRAYEGYRQEAARISEDLEEQLLSSALARLDELPLRLVETSSHGSPWHELLQSDQVQEAAKTVPEFVTEVKDLALSKLRSKSRKRGKGLANDEQTSGVDEPQPS